MSIFPLSKTSLAVAVLATLSTSLLSGTAWSQNFPITPAQKATAQQVAQAGVPLSELAPNAPDSHVVKSGDTLWGISSLFLRSPWRWPELWGMNLDAIRNPHLIYPGQRLVLDKLNGRATLRVAGDSTEPTTVRLSPRTRYQAHGSALTTLNIAALEAFLAEPVIIEGDELARAPRIVAAQDNRVMLTRGDRAYARGPASAALLDDQQATQKFRVFRDPKALKDPDTGEVLGYEGQFVGKVDLVRGESTQEVQGQGDNRSSVIVPATIDITLAKEEMRVSDHLLPEPERQFLSYTPRAPESGVTGRVVSVYGSAVANAAQNQVVVISRGKRDGVEAGHVMAILTKGRSLIDGTDPKRPQMKLPDERNGLLMVFKTFEKLSYALILEAGDAVRVGDRLAAPR